MIEKRLVRSLYDYTPESGEADYLEINEGEIYFLLNDTDDDWWEILKPFSDGETIGIAPASYLTQVSFHYRVSTDTDFVSHLFSITTGSLWASNIKFY